LQWRDYNMKQVINTTDTGTDTAKAGFEKVNANFTELYDKTSNVDNTSDVNKPVSTAQQNALNLKEDTANKALDFSLVNNILYPTIQAVKNFVEGIVVGLLSDRGSYDASGNVFPSTGGSGAGGAIQKGNLWFISAAGTLGGQPVTIGDSIRALVDNPGQTPNNWSIIEVNITYVPENQANKDVDPALAANSDTKYSSQKAVRTFVETIRNALLAIIDTKGHTLIFGHGNFNPADSTTYYFGQQIFISPSITSSALHRVRAFSNGTIKAMNLTTNIATGGSAQNVTLKIKNVTSGSEITVTTTQLYTTGFSTQFSGLNLPVTAGDEIEIQMICPAWTTNPVTVGQRAELFVV